MNPIEEHTSFSETDPTDVTYSLNVGDRIHQVIAQVLAEGIAPTRDKRIAQTTSTTSAVLAAHPMKHGRARAAAMDVSTAASCYFHRFLLDPNWEFVASEMPLGGGRADLVFRSKLTAEWLVDEVKTTRGRTDDAKLRPQIDRYLAGGVRRWNKLFVGVRCCALAQPRKSRLFVPTSQRSVLLTDTSLAGGVA